MFSFLHENTFETQSDEMHRSMMGGGNKNQSNIHHRNTTHNQGHVQPQQHHQSPMLHQHPVQQPLHHPASSAFGSHPADLNPMDFIEQDIIQGGGHHQTPGMISNNAQHNMQQANSGGLVGSNFDVNLDAPFDMMSAFPDLDPNQFNAAGGGAENQHSPLIHQNTPGPMLGSSPMNNMIKNENGMGSNNRSHTGHHTNTQQQRSQQQQSHSNHMQHLNNQNHQHHSHGHPHISDYSPEWGWTDVSKIKCNPTIRMRRRYLYYKTILKILFLLYIMHQKYLIAFLLSTSFLILIFSEFLLFSIGMVAL